MGLKINYDSPVALKNFLDSRGMAMQKKFGQNFLINSQARKLLVDSLKVEENTRVWEVGPGLGCMTSEIVERGGKLTAFEIDRGFATVLKEIFEGKENFSLVEGDVLKTWKNYYKENGLPDRFFGNLPYNVAAAIVADMISEGVRFPRAVVTVQKEVAMRMAAKPGTEDYSSFSVLCQWAYDISNITDLSGGCFWPKPNVESRSVLMVQKEDFPRCKDSKTFMKVLRAIFVQRRKTIKNNLNGITNCASETEEILEKAGIEPTVRAEKLDLETILKLSDVYFDFYKG